MAYTQGEANETSRELRRIAAEIEHAAVMLQLVAMQKASGAQTLIIIDTAREDLVAVLSKIQVDVVD